MDCKFASFSSFNSTRKAVKLLSALDNVKNDFKRPALTMNHISESIIRGVFPKIVRSFANLNRRKCHTVIQLCQTLQHIAKVFAPFPFSHVIWLVIFFVLTYCKKKSVWKFSCISMLWRFLLWYLWQSISFLVLKHSKTLPVKCNIQSGFDLLDFDID